MSTILNTNGADLEIPQPLSKDFSCAIVVAEWNEHITGALLRGAVDVLRQAGVSEENIHVINTATGTLASIFDATNKMICEKVKFLLQRYHFSIDG